MKKFYYIFSLIAIALCVSCSDDDNSIKGFSLETEEITVGPEGASKRIQILSDKAWVATASDPWVSISPANGIGDVDCTLRIDSTLINSIRNTSIRFSIIGETDHIINVHQTGFKNDIVADSVSYHAAYSAMPGKRNTKINVTANVDFKVVIDYEEGDGAWLSLRNFDLNLDRGSRPRTSSLVFDWKMNTKNVARKAVIRFVPKDANVSLESPAAVTLIQGPAPTIEDNRAGDSLAVLLAVQQLGMAPFEPVENMAYWDFLSLWERTDKDLPCQEAIGRVKTLTLFLINTKESLPHELGYLTYLKSLTVQTNVNTMLCNIKLGSEICNLKHLSYLSLFAYGLVSLPDDLVNLGGTLESLCISNNNFTEIPSILTKENFPKLKHLEINACRRWSCSDLRQKSESRYTDGIGLYLDTNKPNHMSQLKRLFLWDSLEYLRLSYNYIEGYIPDFKVGEDGVEAYTEADVAAHGDTIRYALGKPKILPNVHTFSLNLNFFTGSLPDWILYHPNFLEWAPDQLIFHQMESGLNSKGEVVQFDNAPTDFEYYYEAYPLYRGKFEINDVVTD
ncbi:MAG: hypothetical protein Q4C30_00505 [Bacteroidia bacterium]|nr:hypothetical protein [Bacteroidia bacterium]